MKTLDMKIYYALHEEHVLGQMEATPCQ